VLHADYNRWRYRARTYLRAGGYPVATGVAALRAALAMGSAELCGASPSLTAALARCQRQAAALRAEFAQVDTALQARTQAVEAIQRLMTVPGIGPLTAAMIFAWVGDVGRFPHAKQLAAYAGLVPTVRQSGNTVQIGKITKQGAPALRAIMEVRTTLRRVTQPYAARNARSTRPGCVVGTAGFERGGGGVYAIPSVRACRRRRLHAALTRLHSPRTLRRPRSITRRKPIARLISAKGRSPWVLRRA
jgi:transposase